MTTETTQTTPKLVRELKLRDLVLFNLVAVLGLRHLGTTAKFGFGSLLMWTIAAVFFFIPQGLAVIELSSRFPKEGGIYPGRHPHGAKVMAVKSLKIVFTEFTENYVPDLVAGDGDVKYHLGYDAIRRLASGAEIEIRLSANPSHLGSGRSRRRGQARARQRIRGDTETPQKVLPLLVHGDAAFVAQGIVAETLNLSQLPGYSTGGTVHVVVNNQIGFTTLPKDARSSQYATDIAKMIEAPIFHVNGDDPLAVQVR